MDERILKIANDIKELKIQGARKIAKNALKCMEIQTKNSNAKTSDELYSELAAVADLIASQRPTEPMLRNTLRHLLSLINNNTPLQETRKKLLVHINGYFKKVDADLAKIGHFGAQLIENNSTILTHCHSNTVMAILKNAFDIGKRFSVICTETRPRFQGLITAKELSRYGIDTTLIVDSAVGAIIKDVDKTIVGADAITTTGDLINKIGTRTIAEICDTYSVPLYSAAEIYKYDPVTQWGVLEKIEERDPKEIITDRNIKFKVRNPAFDITPSKYITAYITEKGVLAPSLLMIAAKTNLIESPY